MWLTFVEAQHSLNAVCSPCSEVKQGTVSTVHAMKNHLRSAAVAGVILTLSVATPLLADDWVADRLRGSVLILKGGEWTALQRGDVVSDDSYIKTLGNGRVEFTRGAETIALAGHTMIQIIDGNRAKFTNVHQHYGQVTVEAERKDVNHFAVLSPYVAAIVKGTLFTVRSGASGASVSADRGTVGVADPVSGSSVEISPGQGASISPNGQLHVTAANGVELPVVIVPERKVGTTPDAPNHPAGADPGGNNAGGVDRNGPVNGKAAGIVDAVGGNPINANAGGNSRAGNGIAGGGPVGDGDNVGQGSENATNPNAGSPGSNGNNASESVRNR